jgi:hypothetical protein
VRRWHLYPLVSAGFPDGMISAVVQGLGEGRLRRRGRRCVARWASLALGGGPVDLSSDSCKTQHYILYRGNRSARTTRGALSGCCKPCARYFQSEICLCSTKLRSQKLPPSHHHTPHRASPQHPEVLACFFRAGGWWFPAPAPPPPVYNPYTNGVQCWFAVTREGEGRFGCGVFAGH